MDFWPVSNTWTADALWTILSGFDYMTLSFILPMVVFIKYWEYSSWKIVVLWQTLMTSLAWGYATLKNGVTNISKSCNHQILRVRKHVTLINSIETN